MDGMAHCHIAPRDLTRSGPRSSVNGLLGFLRDITSSGHVLISIWVEVEIQDQHPSPCIL